MAKIKSERNAPDLIISVEENQEWTDEELAILKNSFLSLLILMLLIYSMPGETRLTSVH